MLDCPVNISDIASVFACAYNSSLYSSLSTVAYRIEGAKYSSFLMMWLQNVCKLPMNGCLLPIYLLARFVISNAARLVNVKQTISWSSWYFCKAFARRKVSTRVLPEPGGACKRCLPDSISINFSCSLLNIF